MKIFSDTYLNKDPVTDKTDNDAVHVQKTDDNGDKLIVMKGPLAEIFGRALNIFYAKKDNATDEYVLESHAIDTVLIHKKINPQTGEKMSDEQQRKQFTLYGVSKNYVEPQEAISIMKAAESELEEDKSYPIFIVSAMTPSGYSPYVGMPKTECRYMSSALESFAAAQGIAVYPSLEAFLETL